MASQRVLSQSKESLLQNYNKRLKDDVRSILDNFTEIIKTAKVRLISLPGIKLCLCDYFYTSVETLRCTISLQKVQNITVDNNLRSHTEYHFLLLEFGRLSIGTKCVSE